MMLAPEANVLLQWHVKHLTKHETCENTKIVKEAEAMRLEMSIGKGSHLHDLWNVPPIFRSTGIVWSW